MFSLTGDLRDFIVLITILLFYSCLQFLILVPAISQEVLQTEVIFWRRLWKFPCGTKYEKGARPSE